MGVEAINKTQTEGILEMENLGKRTGTTDASIGIKTDMLINGVESKTQK